MACFPRSPLCVIGVTAIGLILTGDRALAAPPGKEFDLQGFIDGQLKAGQRRVVVPPGQYRVTPRHGTHLALKDLHDVEIVTDGVEMICTQTCRAMVFDDCRNVRFRGLTIDYDPLPFTQARIVALAPDKSWLEFEILAGYPENHLEERIEIFDPATGELRRETPGFTKEFQSLGNHRYRAVKPKSYRYRPDWDTEQVGDILVTNHQCPERATGHAVSSARCSGLRLEDITLYAASTFGFVEHRCDATTYLRCKIDRRGAATDLVKRAMPRMRSLNADAFHSVEATQGPAIVDCTAKFQGDDCVNIHGYYHLVTASQGRTIRVAALRGLTIEPGDPVEFLPYAGARPADAVAVKIEPDAPITDAELAFLRKLSLHAPHKEILLAGKATFHSITLDREVPLAMGSAVCSGRRVGNGFVVKGCDFGYNRSRGILIKASRGQVVGNRITHGWMAAVLVAPEFWWFESASSSDLLVSDNTIVGCRRPAIEVIAPGGNGKPLASGAHRNIAIRNNSLTDCAWPNIYVTSTAKLVVQGTRLTPAPPATFVPPLACPWTWGTATPSAIVTEFCDQPDVQAVPPPAAQQRPNILLLMADNWSWPHAGVLGDRLCRTPTFDQLARDGALFAQAFAPHPSCAPSRAAMLTGKVSHRLEDGANLWGRLPARFTVYPDLLEQAGYAIGYAGKGWGPGAVPESGRTRNPGGPKFASLEAFLGTTPTGKPFCFWFSSRHPHRPWNDGREHKAQLRPADARPPAHLPDHPTVRDDILNYACEVTEFDREAAAVLTLLRERGLRQNTLVVMTSDNGWQLPRGLGNCYDSGTRIPLALSWPAKVRGGMKVDAFVRLTDLAATFLDAAGVPRPGDWDSQSLLPLARGETQPDRDAVFVERERHANVRRGDLSYPVRGIRTREFLYLRNVCSDRWPAGDPEYYCSVGEFGDVDYTPSKRLLQAGEKDPQIAHYFQLVFGKRPAEELYDLAKDPGQVNNLASDPEYAQTLVTLRKRVSDWMQATHDPRANGDTDFWDRAAYYAKPSRQTEE